VSEVEEGRPAVGSVVVRARRSSRLAAASIVGLALATAVVGAVGLSHVAAAGDSADAAGRLRMLTQRAALEATVGADARLLDTLDEITATVISLGDAPGPGYDRVAPDGTIAAIGAFTQEGREVAAGEHDPEALVEEAERLLALLDEAVAGQSAWAKQRARQLGWFLAVALLAIGGLAVWARRQVLLPLLDEFDDATTGRADATTDLGQAQRSFQEHLDALPHVVVRTDRQGLVLDCNRQAVEHYGWSREELLGELPPWLTDPAAFVARCARVGHDGFVGQVRRRTRSGGQRSVMSTIRVLSDGTLLHAERDVTEELEMAARQRQRDRVEAVSRLAGGVSHDFNNLLTAIGGHTELLRDDSPPDLGARFDVVLEAVSRARDLVQRLSTVGSVHPVGLVPVDLAALVADAVPVLDAMVGSTVEVRESVAGPAPVLAEPVQLEQVLINLVMNARGALPDGGTVDLGLTVDHEAADGAGRAVLTVSDAGVGIAQEHLDRVFDPFFSTQDASGDHGLGLSLVEGIVTRLGGDIRVESSVGVGTTVTVRLPLHVTAAAPDTRVAEPDQPADDEPHVLVVEDDEHVAMLMQRVLAPVAARLSVVADAAQAQRRAAEGRVDVLVTDLDLPDGDGVLLAERIRAKHPGVRVLVSTGHAPDHPSLAGIAPHELLQKPFRSVELRTRVTALLGTVP
jgi:two-component system, cell cycle sensor histidine kinase and response regulator CckA